MLLLLCSNGINASGLNGPDETERDTLHGSLYLKFNLDIKRRNILMMLVPRLYAIYDGSRFYVGESYGQYDYYPPKQEFRFNEKLRIGTIKYQSTVFPNLIDYITPHLYEETLFNENVLSPFNKKNRRFYRYDTFLQGNIAFLTFRPRVRNSTLTSGNAIIDYSTQKVMHAHFSGEFDHIRYSVNVVMDTIKNIPQHCQLHSRFKLLGNDIETSLLARYNNTADIPSSITSSNNPELMKRARVDSLTQREKAAYDSVYCTPDTSSQTASEGSSSRFRNTMNNVGNALYKYLIRRPSIGNSSSELSMSPVLDPFAIGYSGHTGISYRIKLWAWLTFNDNQDISLAPRIGYNFRQDQIYINAPLRYTFNRKRDGWLELYVSNGNHISNGILLDKIKNVGHRDTLDWDKLDIDYFRDFQTSLQSNIPIGRHFHIGLGAVYHRRSAVNPGKLSELGERTLYHSFAPSFTFMYTPSSYVSYTFNYERGIPHLLAGDSRYERMEFDSQFAVRYNRLTSLNIRFGTGLYTNMDSNNFVDYDMFAENYLPDAWDDDWTGRFFLLNSDLYNASKYYIRSNVSYESPILAAAYIPFLGYFVEKERVYISNLLLHKTSPYTEMGYAFSTRYFSFGIFTSFFGRKFREVGTKIDIELFNRW